MYEEFDANDDIFLQEGSSNREHPLISGGIQKHTRCEPILYEEPEQGSCLFLNCTEKLFHVELCNNPNFANSLRRVELIDKGWSFTDESEWVDNAK